MEKNSINIAGIEYSPQNPLIIAELGTSHNSDINKAREMTIAAMQAGAGCIKFQMVFANEILHPNTGFVDLPGGKISLYGRFKALEAPAEFYTEIKNYVEALGLLFLCTPFGYKSAKLLYELQPKVVKIASPELNFTGLLEEIAGWELPILLSSGVSTLQDIEEAIEIIKSRKQRAEICLLHCVTAYPAPETDYNLKVLPALASQFGIPVGVSDHSSDPELIPALAVSMGAAVIEKHFCLSKNDSGLDDPIALPPEAFSLMAEAVRKAAQTEPQQIINDYNRKVGAEFVERILGNGIKELAASEKANYRHTNRSIHALHDLQAGNILGKNDFAILRTEKNLRPGIEPRHERQIEGTMVKNDIPSGEGIRWEDLDKITV
jgi:sialic acid synthase SpsE